MHIAGLIAIRHYQSFVKSSHYQPFFLPLRRKNRGNRNFIPLFVVDKEITNLKIQQI